MGKLNKFSLHIPDNCQFSGTEGVVESSGESAPNGCKWLLAVEEGMAIEMSFESFNVNICFKDLDLFKELCQIDCSTGYVIVYDGQDGADGLAPLGCEN